MIKEIFLVRGKLYEEIQHVKCLKDVIEDNVVIFKSVEYYALRS